MGYQPMTTTKLLLFFIIALGVLGLIIFYPKDNYLNVSAAYDNTIKRISSSKIHDTHEVNETTEKYPFLLKQIVNQITGETITCNPLKYKYFQQLLNTFNHHFNILNKTRAKVTTADIDEDMNIWCKKGSLLFNRMERVQIIDHVLYVSNNKYYIYGNDPEGYRTSALLYLKSLMQKYSHSITDTDFIWHLHDVQVRTRKHYNWKLGSTRVPYFFTDANIALIIHNAGNVLLGVSRNYMKYRSFGDVVYNAWKNRSIHRKTARLFKRNLVRIEDYLEYKLAIENTTNYALLDWENKTINKALFAGGHSGVVRPKFFKMMNETYIRKISEAYFEISDHPFGFQVADQLKYKYVIVLDGNSVRDGMFYQMEFGAVILKQMSTMYEFWLFDLENLRHVIFFENILHLIAIVRNMVDRMHGYYVDESMGIQREEEFRYFNQRNIIQASEYNVEHLKEIASNAKLFANEYLNEESVDCFMINMLRVYNHYLLDTDSVHKSSSTCRMTELNLADSES